MQATRATAIRRTTSSRPSPSRATLSSAGSAVGVSAAAVGVVALAVVTLGVLPAPLSAAAAQNARRARAAISVTGCLETSREPRVFRLTGAVRADEESDADRTPVSAAGGKSDRGRSYRLVPLGANVILKPYVGHKVEVGGRFMNVDELHRADASQADKNQPADKDAVDKDKAAGAAAHHTPLATIAVTYVRTIAATCGATPDGGDSDK